VDPVVSTAARPAPRRETALAQHGTDVACTNPSVGRSPVPIPVSAPMLRSFPQRILVRNMRNMGEHEEHGVYRVGVGRRLGLSWLVDSRRARHAKHERPIGRASSIGRADSAVGGAPTPDQNRWGRAIAGGHRLQRRVGPGNSCRRDSRPRPVRPRIGGRGCLRQGGRQRADRTMTAVGWPRSSAVRYTPPNGRIPRIHVLRPGAVSYEKDIGSREGR
jgi:hypothetical protein